MIKEYVKRIKPKVKGESDKYSWNVYKLLHKLVSNRDNGEFVDRQLKVYWRKTSWWDGSIEEFNESKSLNTHQVLISPLGSGSFYNLNSVIGNGRAQEFALIYPVEDLTDITDWFFKTYIKDGRCIFDREHNGWWKGDDKRFTYINSTRKCNWCGEWQHKHIEKEVKIKRRVVWS